MRSVMKISLNPKPKDIGVIASEADPMSGRHPPYLIAGEFFVGRIWARSL